MSINPRPCHSTPVTDVTGVGIRNLLAGNLRKSAGIMRFRNGLPRQSVPQGHLLRGADWRAMTRCVGADDQSLPLRGRWQREALAEGETSRGFLSPSRLRRQPPHRGGLAARRCRADGTSRTPPPTLGLPHLSVGRDPCVPPQNTAFVPAGHTDPALQGGSTDSRRKNRKPLRAFFFCI